MRPIVLFASVLASGLMLGCSSRAVDTGPSPEDNATGTSAATSPTGETPTREAVSAAFDADRAMEHTRVLSVDIGERVSGSPEEEEAAGYINKQFTSFGYESAIEPFTFEGNRFSTATVTIAGNATEARPLDGSGGGSAEAPLVFVGLARPADIEGKDLDGAIAVADRGEIFFREKLDNVQAAGAVALVVINTDDELLLGATLDIQAGIPVVSVRSGARAALVAADGAVATLTSSDSVTHSMNVVARAPGTDRCIVLVGAHHDTVPGAPGANDNGSGVGHVLELARVFAADGLDPGLCFATFGGEESGLFGSQALASALEDGGQLPDVMVNFDVTGLGLPVQVIGDRDLVGDAITVADEAGVEVIASTLPPNSSSDHASFEDAGVPVLFFTSGDFEAIHSPGDIYPALSPDSFEEVGVAGYAAIHALYEELAAP